MLSLDEKQETEIIIKNSSLKASGKRNQTQKKRVFSRSHIKYHASMSVEAALVLPIFLFFIMTILMGIEIVRAQSNVWGSLCQSESDYFFRQCTEILRYQSFTEEVGNGSLGKDEKIQIRNESDVFGTGKIEIYANYQIKSFISWMPIRITGQEKLKFEERIFGHAFVGYHGPVDGNGGNVQGEYVFVTKTGVRYHNNIECVSLKIHPTAVPYDEISEKRNADGGKYYPCERCRPKRQGVVFLTKEGDRYHRESNCSSLKRTVYAITLRQAIEEGKTPCARCN